MFTCKCLFILSLLLSTAIATEPAQSPDSQPQWQMQLQRDMPVSQSATREASSVDCSTISDGWTPVVAKVYSIPKDQRLLLRLCCDNGKRSAYSLTGPALISFHDGQLELLSPINGTYDNSCEHTPSAPPRAAPRLIFPQGIVGTRGTAYDFVLSPYGEFFVWVTNGTVEVSLRDTAKLQELPGTEGNPAIAIDALWKQNLYEQAEARDQYKQRMDSAQSQSKDGTSKTAELFPEDYSTLCADSNKTPPLERIEALKQDSDRAAYALYIVWRCAVLTDQVVLKQQATEELLTKYANTRWAKLKEFQEN